MSYFECFLFEGIRKTNGFVCRLQAAGFPRRAYFSYPTYYAIGERVHGSLEELVRNSEADRARDNSIASERSVGGIANRVNGHGTATSLL